MARANRDWKASDLPVWDPANVASSLRMYRAYVEAQALQSMDWYGRSKRTVRLLASGMQYARVVLMGMAAVLPVVGQLWKSALLGNALLASLLVGAAAAVQAADKHLGISAAWVRYVMASAHIRRALEEFRMDWVLLQVKAGPAPSARQVEDFLQLARRFGLTVEGFVSQDTQSWATEFRTFSDSGTKAA